MSESSEHAVPIAHRAALPAVLVGAAVLAIALHRTGHTQGDDFALYIRQARSVFEGDSGTVIADNRFAVVNSDRAFSPIGYPWGWPLILSPFVHLWGYDYDRLKLVEVGLFCVWLAFLHGVTRRRLGRWPALGIVAVFGTSPVFLAHTDQLITEIPHLAVVGLFLWWFDRVTSRSTLLAAPTRDLLMLGALGALVFNVRREGLVLVVVVAAVQLYDLFRNQPSRSDLGADLGADRDGGGVETADVDDPVDGHVGAGDFDGIDDASTDRPWRSLGDVAALVRSSATALAMPHIAFVVAVVLFQLMLPTALLPDNGNSPSNFGDRFAEYPTTLSSQLGLGARGLVGGLVLAVAALGVVIGLRQRPRLDGAILVLAVMSALMISTHIRKVERYWFQVTPWVLYFAVVACLAVAHLVVRQRASIARAAALLPLGVLLVAHARELPDDMDAVAAFNDAGRVQFGPANPTVMPIYQAVNSLTPPDAVVAFFRARTMTLLTDRRSFQTHDINRIRVRADYFAQQREGTYSQPALESARQAGFEEVWSDDVWVLWRVVDNGTDVDDNEGSL
jgi:hypothetical protein